MLTASSRIPGGAIGILNGGRRTRLTITNCALTNSTVMDKGGTVAISVRVNKWSPSKQSNPLECS